MLAPKSRHGAAGYPLTVYRLLSRPRSRRADRLPSAVPSLRAFPLLVLRHGYARYPRDLVTRG